MLLPLLAPQGSSDTLATYRLDGNTEVISRSDLIMDMSRRHRHSVEGAEARQVLVDRVLVRRAAEAKRLMPGAEAVAAELSEMTATIRASGLDMESYLRGKAMSLAAFKRDYVTLALAHKRLVMDELELSDTSEVTPAHLALWLQQERASTPMVIDPKRLPGSVTARIGEHVISNIQFGELLLETMDLDDRKSRIRQIALARLLDARARSLGIEVSPEDARQEVLRNKRRIEADPRYQGLAYEKLLQIQGTSIEELARSEVTVANIQQRRIVLREHPEEELRARLERERAAISKRHGAKRNIHIILLRASDPPNELLPRNYADTLEFAEQLRSKINHGSLRFADAARRYSEEPNTKAHGGEVGMLGEIDKNLPPEIMEAAFACEAQIVPEPVRTDGGFFLVWVSKIGEDPSDAQLIAALRSELAAALHQELFAKAMLDFTF